MSLIYYCVFRDVSGFSFWNLAGTCTCHQSDRNQSRNHIVKMAGYPANQNQISGTSLCDEPCRRRNVIWCRRTYCRDHSTVQRPVSDYFQTTTLWTRRYQRSRSLRGDTTVEPRYVQLSVRPPRIYKNSAITCMCNFLQLRKHYNVHHWLLW